MGVRRITHDGNATGSQRTWEWTSPRKPQARHQLARSQVKALVRALRDIVDVLADADPTAKAEVYNDLGLKLDYSPDGTVSVEARPRGVIVRVGGGTRTITPRAPAAGTFLIAA